MSELQQSANEALTANVPTVPNAQRASDSMVDHQDAGAVIRREKVQLFKHPV